MLWGLHTHPPVRSPSQNPASLVRVATAPRCASKHSLIKYLLRGIHTPVRMGSSHTWLLESCEKKQWMSFNVFWVEHKKRERRFPCGVSGVGAGEAADYGALGRVWGWAAAAWTRGGRGGWRRADHTTVRAVPRGTAPHTPRHHLGASGLNFSVLCIDLIWQKGLCRWD